MPTINYNDQWILERSRALRTELDAAPRADHGHIIDRHLKAAKTERPELATGEPWGDPLDAAILFAAPLAELPPLDELRAVCVQDIRSHLLPPPEG